MQNNYAEKIVEAHKTGKAIDHQEFNAISADEARTVQAEVMAKLGTKPDAFKVMMAADGAGSAAPIFAERVVNSGEALSVPARGVIGLEVELAVVLGKPVTAEMARGGIDAVLPAVDHFVFGIEICATRFDDQKQATPAAQLADNLSGVGYIVGTEPFEGGPAIDGMPLVVTADGVEIYNKPAKHPFGDAIAPIIACALSGENRLGMLDAGALITTGSLCGAVAFTAPCEIVAKIGDKHEVRVKLTA
ncbi:fumarylacetoacetate hydrolase family protein [Martelella endophytica]|uniref:fumarylacetoacetate hydrolase family protein n=1 Tax=Martelella endophytica TaxID=1486262 RepID=UPI000697EF3A|nr:fumarylacetoacetate hydrolase family protein [Martelella endophytica]